MILKYLTATALVMLSESVHAQSIAGPAMASPNFKFNREEAIETIEICHGDLGFYYIEVKYKDGEVFSGGQRPDSSQPLKCETIEVAGECIKQIDIFAELAFGTIQYAKILYGDKSWQYGQSSSIIFASKYEFDKRCLTGFRGVQGNYNS